MKHKVIIDIDDEETLEVLIKAIQALQLPYVLQLTDERGRKVKDSD